MARLFRVQQIQEEKAPASDAPTFVDVYEQYFDYVWQTARRLGVRANEVDDVVQQIFLAVHQLLPNYVAGNLRGWLYAIAARTVLHHHRSMRRILVGRTENVGGDDLDTLPGPVAREPESSARVNETVRLLETLLDRLDVEKRAVLVLAGLEQKSLAEIAEILDINVKTAGSRLRAAREQIQEGLNRHRAREQWRGK
ncbi:hypothetical protein AKJ09_02359 [Labilithrix luteola]|uniref:RNA polymerase sigma factor RpoE n=1 Tax=Labilithrix luteola TaxID=1391654 RepID=A0A0K1PQ73_9BACT|nr:RNA polymerase sigma factor [Labilithrix luteola]AKU95695.1 hypothetical protein AKJ09_02359 [Labilithrix luteola]